MAALDHFVQLPVHDPEELSRLPGRSDVVAHQRPQDGRDQRRAGTVAHHVGDQHPGSVLVEFDQVEEIAADGRCRLIEMREAKPQRIRHPFRRKFRIAGGHQRVLEFTGQFQIFTDHRRFRLHLGLQLPVVTQHLGRHDAEVRRQILHLVAGRDRLDLLQILLCHPLPFLRFFFRNPALFPQPDRVGQRPRRLAQHRDRLQDLAADQGVARQQAQPGGQPRRRAHQQDLAAQRCHHRGLRRRKKNVAAGLEALAVHHRRLDRREAGHLFLLGALAGNHPAVATDSDTE